jgi:aminopeptidase N
MKRFQLLISLLAVSYFLAAQPLPPGDTSWKTEYRSTATRINNLTHTRLELKPDFSKSWLYGKAWLTLKPHFYPTDTLTLDAKGMEIKTLALVKQGKQLPLKYTYNDFQLRIQLDKTYRANESYTIFIDYTAKPEEFQAKYDAEGFLGIKGIYFINPKGEIKDKPTQIWTQSETESASAWFPTIDKTSQKTTQELTVTVDNKYVTLSNGKLVSQKKNADGTRSDYWKMDLPHSPYLFFLGVGNYAVVKDRYKGKEVDYYVEPAFAAVAKKIFGNTPEMMGYFSKITGVEYPWIKYAQITGRDYMAGAMENTTATIHQESAQQDARELVDGNKWEHVIAHELFHQWFGDLVTAESWSNLTLNESFANYSEVLWDEYKYGKDAGDERNYNDMQEYLGGNSDAKDLVRFTYKNREDMFDLVSYNKGGRILHMLRRHLGDSAFFKALNLYLAANKFKSAEVHQLRLAFEEISGQDLNWYFNQWYFGQGHPDVDINYQYNDAAGKVNVIVKQKQTPGKLFRLPLAIDVYNGPNKTRYNIWSSRAIDTFTFSYTKRPDLINVDGDKILLWTKNDEKTLDNYFHQYKYAANYVDRREAIDFAAGRQTDPKAQDLLKMALTDPSAELRLLTIGKLELGNDAIKKVFESTLVQLAKTDKAPTVRGNAIGALTAFQKSEYLPIFSANIRDSSYTVAGNALIGVFTLDPQSAVASAKQLYGQPAKGVLKEVIQTILIQAGDEKVGAEMIDDFAKLPVGTEKFSMLQTVASFLQTTDNTDIIKKGVNELAKLREAVPEGFRSQTDPAINGALKTILASKVKIIREKGPNAPLQEVVDLIKSKLPEEEKRGF